MKKEKLKVRLSSWWLEKQLKYGLKKRGRKIEKAKNESK